MTGQELGAREQDLGRSRPCDFEGCNETTHLYRELLLAAEQAEEDPVGCVPYDVVVYYWRCDDGHREPATEADLKGVQ